MTSVVACWRFQLLPRYPAVVSKGGLAEKELADLAGRRTLFQVPAGVASKLMPEADLSNGRGGGPVDHVDRRNGTAEQSILRRPNLP